MPTDQSQVTNQIAQNVQSNANATNPGNVASSAPDSSNAQYDPTPTLLGRIIFGNAAHNQFLSQQLQQKYRTDLMNQELQFKQKQARQAAEFQTWDQLVSQGGSKVFNSPEAQKYFHKDPELYDVYKQKAALVDQHQALGGVLNAMFAKQLGMNVTPQQAAQMSPDQLKVLEAQQKNAITMRGQDIGLHRTELEQSGANSRNAASIAAANARNAASIAGADERAGLKGAGKQGNEVTRLNSIHNDYIKLHPIPKGWNPLSKGDANPEYMAGLANYSIERGVDPQSGKLLKDVGQTKQANGYYNKDGKLYLVHNGTVKEVQ